MEYIAHTQNSGTPAQPTALAAGRPYMAKVFQVMSNELSTPKVCICPADSFHSVPATNFGTAGTVGGDFDTNKISFFISGDSQESDPQMIMFGDCNMGVGVTGAGGAGTPASARQITPPYVALGGTITTANASWTIDTHNKVGNLALADGSVSQVSIAQLRTALSNGTNTVIYPTFQFPW
jgi:hypothetical protein